MAYTKSQVAKLQAAGVARESFVHSVLGHIDITTLRLAIAAMKPPAHTFNFADTKVEDSTMTAEEALQFLLDQREVDEERVNELTLEQLEEPIITLIDDGGYSYVVDGIHRLTARFRRGYPTFSTYILHEKNAPRIDSSKWVDLPWGEKELINGKLRRRK